MKLGVLAAAGCLLLASCGDDGGSSAPSTTERAGPRTPYASALADAIAPNQANLGLSDEQTFCLANGVVEALGGREELEDAGITPEELAAADSPSELGLDTGSDVIDDVAETYPACGVDLVAVFLDGIAVGVTVNAEAEACFQERLDADILAVLAAEQLVTGEQGDVPDSLTEAVVPCLELLESPEANSTSSAPSV